MNHFMYLYMKQHLLGYSHFVLTLTFQAKMSTNISKLYLLKYVSVFLYVYILNTFGFCYLEKTVWILYVTYIDIPQYSPSFLKDFFSIQSCAYRKMECTQNKRSSGLKRTWTFSCVVCILNIRLSGHLWLHLHTKPWVEETLHNKHGD